MNKRKTKKKLSTGTKENITRVINNLSIIIGRKAPPKENTREIINEAYKVADLYIAALALTLPEIDQKWSELGAKSSFLRIKQKRQWKYRLSFGLAILATVIILVISILAIIFLNHWSKWIILGIAVFLIFIGSIILPQHVITPNLLQYDLKISEKYRVECNQIDQFIKYLLNLRF